MASDHRWQRVHEMRQEQAPSAPTRWASHLAGVFLFVILGALANGFWPWIIGTQMMGHDRSRGAADIPWPLKNETIGAFHQRLWIGALAGAVIWGVTLALFKLTRGRIFRWSGERIDDP